jgi:hypothetical protein
MDFIRAQSAKEQLAEQLPMTKNVIGTGVGLKYINGRPTTEPAVIVFVEKKYSDDEFRMQSDLEFIPCKIDGVQTDIIEVGQIVPQSLRAMCRPLMPGVSVGHRGITAGTIGGFFTDRNNDLVILSNNHVIANENSASIGDEIVQPGPMDAHGDISVIGHLKAFQRIEPSNNLHDSAIAKVLDNIKVNAGVNIHYPSLNRPIAGWGASQIQLPVQKVGRTTGYTNGRIIATNATFTIAYGFGPATFVDCIVCTNMSAGGDSGSVILDMNMNAVGLLFAGSGKVTLATPIDKVRDHYSLQIYQNSAVKSAVSLNLDEWPDLIDKPTTLYGDDWHQVECEGTSELFDSHLEIVAKTNRPCYWEHDISTQFDLARVNVKRDSDEGETFGPGMALIWSNGMVKMNLQANGQVCGTVNKLQYSVETNGEERVSMRIKREGKTICGEYLRDGVWVTVMCVPSSIVEGEPKLIRVGKMDTSAGCHELPQEEGKEGRCEISDLLYS